MASPSPEVRALADAVAASLSEEARAVIAEQGPFATPTLVSLRRLAHRIVANADVEAAALYRDDPVTVDVECEVIG